METQTQNTTTKRRTLEDTIELIKDIISPECGNRFVYDGDVAKALGIAPGTLATQKKRGKYPYDEIIDFAMNRKLDLNYILFQGVRNVV